jgi:hypothetical protein
MSFLIYLRDIFLALFVTVFLMGLFGAAVYIVAQAIFMKSIFLALVSVLVYYVFYKLANGL